MKVACSIFADVCFNFGRRKFTSYPTTLRRSLTGSRPSVKRRAHPIDTARPVLESPRWALLAARQVLHYDNDWVGRVTPPFRESCATKIPGRFFAFVCAGVKHARLQMVFVYVQLFRACRPCNRGIPKGRSDSLRSFFS